MKMNRKNILTALLSLILAVFLVFYQFKKLNLSEVKNILSHVDYFYIVPSLIFGFLAMIIRGLRWKLMLEPINYKVSNLNCIAATAITYFANVFIPRSGEIFRCTSLLKTEDVPVNKSFGTVLAERIVDLICLGIVFVLAAIFNLNLFIDFSKEVYQKRMESTQELSFDWVYGLSIFVFFILLLYFFTKNNLKKLAIYKKIEKFLMGLKDGVFSIGKLKNRNVFIFYTILIWVLYFYMTYIMVFALPETAHLNHAEGLFIMFAGAVGMVIPSSGGIGPYHLSMGLAFLLLGLTEELGNSVAILVHTPHTLFMLLMGAIGIGVTFFANKRKHKKTH